MKPKKYSKPPPPVGQASNGPIGLVCQTGTSWHLPNCAVVYPFSSSVCARGAQVLGRIELYPGAAVASSVMTPIPTEWWLRPDSSAARVGAHSAVVWKRLYFKPLPARRSAGGVAHGPPNALDAAKPTSSSKTTSTLGAPAGGRSGSIAANDASGSLASYGSVPSNGPSGIGNTSRCGPSDSAWLTKVLSTACSSGHSSAPARLGSSPDPDDLATPPARAAQSARSLQNLAPPLGRHKSAQHVPQAPSPVSAWARRLTTAKLLNGAAAAA